MKSITHIPAMILLLIVMTAAAVSQPGRGNRVEKATNAIKEKVGLTDSQTEKVRAILEKSQSGIRKEFEANNGDRAAMREAMIKHTAASDGEIEALLTKEQKKKFEQYRKERDEEIRNRMKERRR